MYKAILASVILGSMSVAQATDVKWSGDFGYRNDSLEVGAANSDRDRFEGCLVPLHLRLPDVEGEEMMATAEPRFEALLKPPEIVWPLMWWWSIL